VSESLAPGTLVGGRYRVGELLGAGGEASVYEATTETGERVALKILRPTSRSGTSKQVQLERLRREAEAIARLAHPNVVLVRVVVVEPPPAASYLVMELVAGESLRQRLMVRHRLTPVEVTAVADQILAALEAAHASGIVHRDLKPENVLVDDATVKVLDFGIAKLDSRRTKLTATGMIVGTAEYLSPEVLRGAQAGTSADLWATGVVLYELLTGELPFDGDDFQELAHEILMNDPPPLSDAVPRRLRRVVGRALRKRPDERWASATEMRAALHADVEPRVRSSRVSTTAPPQPARRDLRVLVLLGALVLAAGVAAGIALASSL